MRLSRIIYFFFILIFASSFIAATISVGNISSDIKEKYSPGENLKGWINISVINEPFNSEITAFNSRAILKAVLDENGLVSGQDYNCSTVECGMDYRTADSGSSGKNLTLNAGESKLLGIKILENKMISEIKKFKINMTSSAGESCVSQLSVDLWNDGIYDFYSNKQAASFCGNEIYGCYSSQYKSPTEIPSGESYCQNIFVESASALKVGAEVVAVDAGTAEFEFVVDEEKSCSNTISSSGKVSCVVNVSVDSPRNVSVCLREVTNNVRYKIYFEDHSPICGYTSQDAKYDFSIFAHPARYAGVGRIIMESSDELSLEGLIDEKIGEIYGYDCSQGCYISINITSKENNQQIVINNIEFSYRTDLVKENNLIYVLEQEPSKLTMSYKELNLDSSGLKVPSSTGFNNFTLKINNYDILRKRIEVASIPIIEGLITTEIPAAADFKIRAIVFGSNATKYTWDFGDNSTGETTVPYVNHKYAEIGNYDLKLTAANSFGESSKTFTLQATSPKAYLNTALADYKKKVNNLKLQVSLFPATVKNYIDKQMNLTEKEATIVKLKNDYDNAGNDDSKYISIVNSLNELSLPDSINLSVKASGRFLFNKDLINLENLNSLSGEEYTGTEEANREAIFSWFTGSLNVVADLKVYSSVYGLNVVPFVSYVSFRILPRESFEKVYVVTKDSAEIVGVSDVKSLSQAKGFALSDLQQNTQKNLEVLIPEKLSLSNIPVYFFPPAKDVKIIDISVCNFNGVCEKNLNEDWKNCRSDCKPWGRTILYLLLLLFLFFCLYIFLQELYKRKYEDYLFKDKNDLFNLINFIKNAEKQGLKKEEIFAKLKEKGWDREQMEYAYKKYKGERTGMWEIPVLKFWEKMKINKAIEKINPSGKLLASNVPPKPIRPFIRPVQLKPMVKPQQPLQNQKQPQQQQKPQDKGNEKKLI